MTHWSRKCRCAGVDEVSPVYLGMWCGRPADEEDGLCVNCRAFCTRHAVLTPEQARARDALFDLAD